MGAERGADVIVVGAGIIGAACAWRLARKAIASRWWTIAAPAPPPPAWGIWCAWTIIRPSWR